ncbi:hypothetical protein AB0A74_36590 [Saccharothrix sp. NPDC042600]|uniref:hypothetical protein n=1 Tax=Saccharothrix TaxID=2071 RepID=UPI003401CFF5|nr:hypothetical protein GCM10017745_39480 [Saccharothrix mutabilis subsp. capreolus]
MDFQCDEDRSPATAGRRALRLWRAYAYRDPELVATLLDGLDTGQVEQVAVAQVAEYNHALRTLAGRRVGLPAVLGEIDRVAATAPPELEFAITTAVRAVTGGAMDMGAALRGLHPVDRAHALAICITAANIAVHGRAHYQNTLDALDGTRPTRPSATPPGCLPDDRFFLPRPPAG